MDAAGTSVDADDRMWFTCRNDVLAGCTGLASTPGGRCSRLRPHPHPPRRRRHGRLAEFKVAETAN